MKSVRRGASNLVQNASALRDGIRYARQLPPPRGEGVLDAAKPGRLAEYFEQHTEGPGLWKWRHYFPIYERHFAPFVGRSVHIVEVGIFSGGSLPMWREYFGEDAHIHGIDIEEACRVYAGEKISVYIGDQADPAFWHDFLVQVPRIDILIDDGGHTAQQQIATLKATLPALSPGGVYVCEDSKGARHGFHSFIDSLDRPLHNVREGRTPSTLQQHVSSIHRYPLLTVIEKPLLPVAPFEAPKHGTIWEPFLQ
jgi:hypothetical protein